MTEQPLLTVITVCRNSARLLETTLNSVAEQDYPNKEFIIVDGASTDDTVDVIESHSKDVSKWVSEPDGGIYDAMNKGVRMASGDYCIFMNAGDTFADKATLSKVVEEATGADVIYGDVVKHDKSGAAYVKGAESPRNCHRMYFCHQSAFTRTACLREVPYDTSYTMSADFKLYKTLWKKGKRFEQVHCPVAVFDTHGVSNTHRADGLRQNIGIVKGLDGFIDKLRFLPRLYFVFLMARLRHK